MHPSTGTQRSFISFGSLGVAPSWLRPVCVWSSLHEDYSYDNEHIRLHIQLYTQLHIHSYEGGSVMPVSTVTSHAKVQDGQMTGGWSKGGAGG